jgi:hypothetical protein
VRAKRLAGLVGPIDLGEWRASLEPFLDVALGPLVVRTKPSAPKGGRKRAPGKKGIAGA